MIINTEIRDLTQFGTPVMNSYGVCKRFLCISYVDDNQTIQYFTYVIPDEWMYQWKYAKRGETGDPYYKSWDFKPVVKTPIVGKFSEQRVHEMIVDLQRLYPDDKALCMLDKFNIPKTCYMDIEVDVTDDGFPEAADANNTINTVSYVIDNDVYVLGLADLKDDEISWIENEVKEHCKKFKDDYHFHYRYHPNEESLLNDLIFNFIKTSQCITGWNFFLYDWPYIYNRVKKYYPFMFARMTSKQELSVTGEWFTYRPQKAKDQEGSISLPMHKAMYDYLEVYAKWDRKISPKISNKLDWVAEKVLGVKKVVHQLGFKEMWEQQKKEYVFYNAIDSVLVREIDLKLRTSAAFFGLANIMHTPALTAFSSTKSIEIVQAEYLYKEGRVFPSVKNSNEKKEYEGAFVFEPKAGIYRNVLTLDYASLYPTTMRQFNISPDTLLFKDKNYLNPKPNEIKCTNGCVYTRDFKGFIPNILTDFYAKRKSFKKEMQAAEKEKNELEDILKRRKENMVK